MFPVDGHPRAMASEHDSKTGVLGSGADVTDLDILVNGKPKVTPKTFPLLLLDNGVIVSAMSRRGRRRSVH